MGEKVEESFSPKNPEKFAGPECRAAGRSRHAEPLMKHGAEFELSQFHSSCVSHARRALAVWTSRKQNFLSSDAVAVNHSLLNCGYSFHDTLTKALPPGGDNAVRLLLILIESMLF
jgi:hypothetical protein